MVFVSYYEQWHGVGQEPSAYEITGVRACCQRTLLDRATERQ